MVDRQRKLSELQQLLNSAAQLVFSDERLTTHLLHGINGLQERAHSLAAFWNFIAVCDTTTCIHLFIANAYTRTHATGDATRKAS